MKTYWLKRGLAFLLALLPIEVWAMCLATPCYIAEVELQFKLEGLRSTGAGSCEVKGKVLRSAEVTCNGPNGSYDLASLSKSGPLTALPKVYRSAEDEKCDFKLKSPIRQTVYVSESCCDTLQPDCVDGYAMSRIK